MLRKCIFALLCLSCVSFIPGIPPLLKMACGILQAFYLPGFVFLLFFWDRRCPTLDDIFIPPLISPIALSLLIVAVFSRTHSFGASIPLCLLILYALLLVAFIGRRRFRASDATETVPRAIVLISLVLCGMVGVFYALNTYLLVRSDALFHAPVVSEILDHGIPPREPRLPDAHIRYMWFYHLSIAAFVKLSNLSIFQALGAFNVMNAFVFPYLVARATARFTKKHSHLCATPLLAIAGVSSASWILWPVCLLRTLWGEVKGHAELARILGSIDVSSYRVIYFLTPPWTFMANTLDKILTITPFNYAINLFLLCFVLVLSKGLENGAPFITAVNITFIMVGTFLMHIVTGAVLMLTAFGAAILMLMGRWLRKWEDPRYFQTVVIPILALLAGVVCLPYLRSLTGRGSEGTFHEGYLHFGIMNLITMFAPMVGLLFVIKPLLTYLLHPAGTERTILTTWLASLFIINVCINAPGENEMKFVSLLFALLVIPVSIVLVDWTASLRGFRRMLALIWISVLFLVPTFLTARGFFLDQPETDERRAAHMPSNDGMQLYDWIRTHTDTNSVVTELHPESYSVLYAHRHALIPLPTQRSVFGYTGANIDRYVAIQREIFSQEPLLAASIDYLRSLGFDIYVMVWAEDLKTHPYLADKFRSLEPLFKEAFENPAGTVYSVTRAGPR